MIAPVCVSCRDTVLELRGQYTLLDSYYLEESGPPPETSGDWHLSCLAISPFREAWYEARLRNHVDVRGCERVADVGMWTVVKHPRTGDVTAFSRDGQILDLVIDGQLLQRVEGGVVYSDIREQFHLEVDDADAIRQIQEEIFGTKSISVLRVHQILGIESRVVHPESLRDSKFFWKRGLANMWTPDSVSMRADYGYFVPQEVAQYVVIKKARKK